MKEKCEKCQTDLIEKDGQKICLHCNPVKHEVPENACQNCKTVPEWDGFLMRFVCGCDIILQ